MAATEDSGYIAQLEMGLRKSPSLDVLKRIAKALGVPVTELLECEPYEAFRRDARS